jgi:hypothetical protein
MDGPMDGRMDILQWGVGYTVDASAMDGRIYSRFGIGEVDTAVTIDGVGLGNAEVMRYTYSQPAPSKLRSSQVARCERDEGRLLGSGLVERLTVVAASK